MTQRQAAVNLVVTDEDRFIAESTLVQIFGNALLVLIDDPETATEIIAAQLAMERQIAEGPEWKCPSCGATTRARMADQ